MKIAEIRAQFPQYADISDGELVRGLHKKFYSDIPYEQLLRKVDFRPPQEDVTKEMTKGEQFAAGAGKAFVDLGQGASQIVGAGPNAEEVKNRRELDRPLMNTKSGMAGNIGANITAFAPLAVVPGGATVGGAATLAALTGALQPAEGTGDRLKNMATGAAFGGVTQAAAGPGAKALGEWGASREVAAKALQSQNAVRDATLEAGQKIGLSVPQSAVNPTMMSKVLESVGGKAAVGQDFSLRNQKAVDAVMRQEANLAPTQALSEQALRDARRAVAGPYRELTAISSQAKADMEALKQARLDSKLNWQDYSRNQTVSAYKEAQKADKLAEALENSIETQAANVGKPELVAALRDARKQIAKIHDVEKALNVGTGSVDASVIGRMRDRGAPLSDGLKTVGDFQQAFSPYMREASKIPTPGVSKLAAVLSGGMGAGGFAAGGPMGTVAAALPFTVPPAARSIALKFGKTAKPDYSLSAREKMASAMNDPATREKMAMLARSLALPAVPYAVGGE